MASNESKKGNPADGILKGMRHHSRPEALAEVSKYSKERSENSDDHHIARALVGVTETEDRGGDDDPNHGVAPERAELALQVSAEDDFFKESGANAQQNKESGLKIGVRRHWTKNAHGIIDGFLQVMEIDEAQGNAEDGKQYDSDKPKSQGDAHVQQERFHGFPLSADQITHADPAQPDPEPYQEDQHKWRDKGAAIQQESRAMALDRTDLGRGEIRVAQDQCGEKQGVPHGRDQRWLVRRRRGRDDDGIGDGYGKFRRWLGFNRHKFLGSDFALSLIL